MERLTEREFYEKLNEIDSDDGHGWLIGHCICAMSGFVLGLSLGYFLGAM